jgi:hypothetical protein
MHGRKKNSRAYMDGSRKDFAGLEKEARGGRRVHTCMHGRSRSGAPSAPLTARDEECAAWSYYGVKANGFSRNEW